MMEIFLSANIIRWPDCCACCCREADTHLVITATSKAGTGTRSTHEVPYCSRCIGHIELCKQLAELSKQGELPIPEYESPDLPTLILPEPPLSLVDAIGDLPKLQLPVLKLPAFKEPEIDYPEELCELCADTPFPPHRPAMLDTFGTLAIVAGVYFGFCLVAGVFLLASKAISAGFFVFWLINLCGSCMLSLCFLAFFLDLSGKFRRRVAEYEAETYALEAFAKQQLKARRKAFAEKVRKERISEYEQQIQQMRARHIKQVARLKADHENECRMQQLRQQTSQESTVREHTAMCEQLLAAHKRECERIERAAREEYSRNCRIIKDRNRQYQEKFAAMRAEVASASSPPCACPGYAVIYHEYVQTRHVLCFINHEYANRFLESNRELNGRDRLIEVKANTANRSAHSESKSPHSH